MSLLPLFAGVYSHQICHDSDAFFHPSTSLSGFNNVIGGWHDADDYGKYVVNAGVTIGTLLMGYELFPDRFKQDNIGIPESGNEIPDILDEVRYELEWLIKMQSSNGGVYHKVSPEKFEGFILPQNDRSVRYVFEVSSTSTGDFIAMMARAARVFVPFDSTFSKTCLKAARRAWTYLESHPGIIPSGGF